MERVMPFTQAFTGQQIGWYETSLPLTERKKRGHFSTPPYLVEQILDACGYKSQADLAHIRVLDPACGSGNFLVGATQRLAASCKHKQLSQEEQALLVQRNIWGFDPDPVSCFLAKMQMYSMMNIHPHIHQADSLTLPWEPCVDLFLANPPYLAAKNNDLSGYRSAQQRGQADSYLLFLALALQVVRPGGWIGLVLPDPVLARLNAARERAQLLKQVTLHHLWHLSGVFPAEVGAVVLIAQKCPPKSLHQVSWVRGRWRQVSKDIVPRVILAREGLASENRALKDLAPTRVEVSPRDRVATPFLYEEGCQKIPQALFVRQPRAEFRYLLTDERSPILGRLCKYLEGDTSHHFAPLSQFL